MCRPTTVSELSYKSPLSHYCQFYDNYLSQVEDEENSPCTLWFHPTAKTNPPQAPVTHSCEAWLWYPERKWEGDLRAVRMWVGKKGREMVGNGARSKQERNVVRELLTSKLSSFPVSFSVKWSTQELQEEAGGFFSTQEAPGVWGTGTSWWNREAAVWRNMTGADQAGNLRMLHRLCWGEWDGIYLNIPCISIKITYSILCKRKWSPSLERRHSQSRSMRIQVMGIFI